MINWKTQFYTRKRKMKYTTRKSLLTNIYCTPDRCCLRRYGNVPYSLLSHILWHHEIYAISVNIFTCTQYKFQFIYRLLSKLLISFWKHFLNSQNLFCLRLFLIMLKFYGDSHFYYHHPVFFSCTQKYTGRTLSFEIKTKSTITYS